jgi:hypothetical protein
MAVVNDARSSRKSGNASVNLPLVEVACESLSRWRRRIKLLREDPLSQWIN